MIENKEDFIKKYIKKWGLPDGATHIYVPVIYALDSSMLFEKHDVEADEYWEYSALLGKWIEMGTPINMNKRYCLLEYIMEAYVNEERIKDKRKEFRAKKVKKVVDKVKKPLPWYAQYYEDPMGIKKYQLL